MNIKIPKVFISYSWDNEIHKHWVLDLATQLRRNQVDVILDIWELRAGKDKDFFMENSVRESDKVLLIMTPNYKVKAENRKGGVGNEISMIRAEKFNCQETEKFIPIVRLGDREDCTPLFAKSLVDIDMSIDDNFEESFEELLRTIYEEPKYKKPLLGQKPQFTKPQKLFDLEFDLEQIHTVSINEINDNLSGEMISDLNTLDICISDPSPIVFFFGAQCSGKTMSIIRLTQYLQKNGYIVEPDRVFRSDKYYKTICDRFEEEVDSDIAAAGSSNIDFMLLRVLNNYRKQICQILDVPGVHCFYYNKNTPFPSYINKVICAENKKIWMFLVELDWGDRQTRIAYDKKIVQLSHMINPKDKTILMCNKVDLQPQYFFKGLAITERFFERTKNQYPYIFGNLKSRILTTKLFSPYLFDFIPFSAGKFFEQDNTLDYTPSDDRYPAVLWKAILRAIKE